MKVSSGKPWLRTAFAAAALLLVSGPGLSPGGPATAQSRPQMRPPSKVKVGAYPPDFELPFLALERDEAGKPVGRISKKTFRLSSMRGKRPVCLFMSSYT